jgi:hypothetical protein
MFGTVTIQQSTLKNSKPKLFVPERAIQKIGTETVVFKQIAPNQYRKTVVKLSDKVAEGYFIEQGVTVGEQVVGQGSFTLKAEWLKNQSAPNEE